MREYTVEVRDLEGGLASFRFDKDEDLHASMHALTWFGGALRYFILTRPDTSTPVYEFNKEILDLCLEAAAKKRCDADECPGYKAKIIWYSRKKILSQVFLSGVLPSWTGYRFHYRCYLRWRERRMK